MHSGRFFWGTFLIGLGTVILLQRLEVFSLDLSVLWKFWPLVLVFWGVAVITRGKPYAPVSSALAGLTLAVVLGTVIYSGPYMDTNWDHPVGQSQEFRQEKREGLRRASFRFESGAGAFSAEGVSDDLFEASVRTDFGHYVQRSERIEESEDVSLVMEGERKVWAFTRASNRVAMKFNPDVPWDMRFATGASTMDLDLSALNVERVAVEAGASQVRMRLGGHADETKVAISSGVSNVRILVPRSSACEISTQSPLSRKSFKDFTRSEEGTWRTENFSSAGKKIVISLESGLSNLTVVRY